MIINIFLKRSDTEAYPSYQAQAVHHDHHQQLSALKSKKKNNIPTHEDAIVIFFTLISWS